MMEDRQVENRYVAISQRNIIWYTTADLEPNDSHVTKNENFKNCEMADSYHNENRFGALLSSRLSYFCQI